MLRAVRFVSVAVLPRSTTECSETKPGSAEEQGDDRRAATDEDERDDHDPGDDLRPSLANGLEARVLVVIRHATTLQNGLGDHRSEGGRQRAGREGAQRGHREGEHVLHLERRSAVGLGVGHADA